MIVFFSICENPAEIDARVMLPNEENTQNDWFHSNSVLIYKNDDNPNWNLGISKKG